MDYVNTEVPRISRLSTVGLATTSAKEAAEQGMEVVKGEINDIQTLAKTIEEGFEGWCVANYQDASRATWT